MKKVNLNKLIITGMSIALCTVMPLAFHAIPDGGKMFSPMHMPVLICAIACGFQYGAICGAVGPIISSLTTGLPAMGNLAPMVIECMAYGIIAGIMMKFVRTRSKVFNLYASLVVAMICGRIIAGIAKALYFSPGITLDSWISAYFVISLPGIIVQLLLIPPIVYALDKAKLIKI